MFNSSAFFVHVVHSEMINPCPDPLLRQLRPDMFTGEALYVSIQAESYALITYLALSVMDRYWSYNYLVAG